MSNVKYIFVTDNNVSNIDTLFVIYNNIFGIDILIYDIRLRLNTSNGGSLPIAVRYLCALAHNQLEESLMQ